MIQTESYFSNRRREHGPVLAHDDTVDRRIVVLKKADVVASVRPSKSDQKRQHQGATNDSAWEDKAEKESAAF